MDKKTFENLVKDHSPSLRSYAMKFCNNGMPVEDLMQETWLRAWKYRDTKKNPKAWLITILRNENARQYDDRAGSITRKMWENSSESFEALVEQLNEETVDIPSQTAMLLLKLMQDIDTHNNELLLNQSLDKLSKMNQEIALLRMAGYNIIEIGEHYGIPKNTVGVRFKRILDKLQDM